MIRRWASAFLAAICLPFAAAHAAQPASAENFFRKPFLSEVAVSPSGRHLAAAVPTDGGRVQLAVMELAPLGPPKVVAAIAGSDISDVRWVNDERLVFSTVDLKRAMGDQNKMPGLYAVNRDGSDFRQLIHRVSNTISAATGVISRILTWEWDFVDTVEDGSPDIIVGQSKWDAGWDLISVSLYRLNTSTGEKRLLSAGAPEGAQDWLMDAKGEPRAVTAYVGNRRHVWWRRGDSREWERIGDFGKYRSEGFRPVFVDAGGTLYVAAPHGAAGTEALFRFDADRKQPEPEPLVSVQGFDLEPRLQTHRGQFLGLHFLMEQGASYWFDRKLRTLQAGVDKALPGRSNRLHCGKCVDARAVVVESKSDRQPGEFFLLDTQDMSMKRIAAARPWVDEATQGTRSFHRYKARDGLEIPAVVTHPPGAAQGRKLPTVVLVHGGPWLRGAKTSWNGDAQFLASRGYLVVEPDFRGSEGYGYSHFKAGLKQWGLSMQDDLQDALKWAAAQGWADADKACIMGGSYGGYAALMGTVRHPESWRCAISIAGVTDIELMYSITWSDFNNGWKRYGMPLLVGDREKDAAQLQATSPLAQASRIKTPLLLIHGVADVRVPIDHERKFRAAVSSAGTAPEYLEYSDEGHGGWLLEHEVEFWQRIDQFLAKHLR
ncbi:alpha/beta hydrolase family protein [Ramlibacter sp. PS4R-6]|uniref:alpha/beta hydrolase family protein n=1 Tax=Ramlibacter sp. PS4R-6 TaxID=3133438 RepID=UPI0030AA16EE